MSCELHGWMGEAGCSVAGVVVVAVASVHAHVHCIALIVYCEGA